MASDVAVLGIKVDPRGAISGAAKAKRAISGIGATAAKAKSAIFSLQGALAGAGAASLVKSVVKTASEIENLKVRLKFITGSAEDAAKAFKQMDSFASKVPFTLQDIQAGSAPLLTVAENVDELNELLEITGDIAAVSGLSFQETAMQIQRAFGAGIASADQFRERGISALLGFEQGVSYSADQTRQKITRMWRDGTTTAKGATKELADTFTGQVSMMQDAWDKLLLEVAKTGVFEGVTTAVKGITDTLTDPSVKEGIRGIGAAIKDSFQWVIDNKDILLPLLGGGLAAKLAPGPLKIPAAIAGSGFGSDFFSWLEERRAALTGKPSGDAMQGLLGEMEQEQFRAEVQREPFTPIQDVPVGAGPVFANAGEIKETTALLDEQRAVVNKVKKSMGEAFDARSAERFRLKMLALNELLIEQPEHVDQINAAMRELQEEFDELHGVGADSADTIKDSWKEAAEAMKDSMADAITDSIINFKSLGDAVSSVGNMIASMIVKRTIATPLANALGDTLGEMSFDGGGFTGMGSRSGGVDGKGGFPAILHPNETVIDHTKGQSMGGGDTINVTYSPQVNALDPRTASAVIASNASTIVGIIEQSLNRRGRSFA